MARPILTSLTFIIFCLLFLSFADFTRQMHHLLMCTYIPYLYGRPSNPGQYTISSLIAKYKWGITRDWLAHYFLCWIIKRQNHLKSDDARFQFTYNLSILLRRIKTKKFMFVLKVSVLPAISAFRTVERWKPWSLVCFVVKLDFNLICGLPINIQHCIETLYSINQKSKVIDQKCTRISTVNQSSNLLSIADLGQKSFFCLIWITVFAPLNQCQTC